MGKWTLNYTDNVLHAKVSALVTGAIRRSNSEEPQALPLSYNDFVNELDVGDSFTTTLVDILVKEVMERRKRTPADRRYISERTAKSLRQLTGALNIYRGRTTRPWTIRRAPTAPGPEPVFVDTDEDEFEHMMEDSNLAEGSHMSSSELFDAMSIYPLARQVATGPIPYSEGGATPPLPAPRTAGPWTVIPSTSTASNTTRQHAPLRRNIRTRAADFNDFTRRHRPSLRASLAAARASEGEASPPEVVTEPRTEDWGSQPPSTTRRFFALNRLRRSEAIRRQTSAFSQFSEGTDASGEDDTLAFINIEDHPIGGASTSAPGGPSSTGWTTVTPPEMYVSPRAIMVRGLGTETPPPPPLRRGGVAAPENILLSPQPQPLVPLESRTADPVDSALGEPAAYPTPGSVENEHLT